MRADRPIGVFLLLWPTLTAFFLITQGSPDIKLIFIFIIGTFLMRSAGCVINDYFDRNFDGQVKRTKNRPLVTGAISPNEALGAFSILISLSSILLLWTNLQTFFVALIGLGVAIIYPLSKRFFSFPQLFLGIAFSWGIIMVSAAENILLSQVTLICFLACFFWIQAYDTEYAMCDIEDDFSIGIGSSAIFLGKKVQLFISIFHLISLSLWSLAGYLIEANQFFYLAIFFSFLLSCYQYCLIKDSDPEKCLLAFKNNNWVGLIIFIGSFFGT
tara:strand:+ start:1503 stop:2318 length:816 start_codon:yes stop_codon:yes gene_type:complete